MNQSELLQLFNQPIPEGYSIQELDQLLQFIQSAFMAEQNLQQIESTMENNFSMKFMQILQTIYHFDSISQLNPQLYNSAKFRQLLLFVTLQFRKISLVQQESDLCIIFSLTIKVGLKYFKSKYKLIQHLLNSLFESIQEKHELFDFLLQQMAQQFENPNQSQDSLMSILFILDQLLQYLFNIRTLDQQLQIIVEKIIYQFQNINYSNLDKILGQILSSILVICIQKYNYYIQDKLLILSQNQYILNFMSNYIFLDDIITANISKSLCLLIKNQTQIQSQLQFDQNQIPLLAQLVNQILPKLLQIVLTDQCDAQTQITLLQVVLECIDYVFVYNFFFDFKEEILFQLILDKLFLTEDEISNFFENTTEAYELIQAIVGKDNDSVKGIVAQILQKLVIKIDGFFMMFFQINMELLQIYFETINETTYCNKLKPNTLSCRYFKCEPDNRYHVIILSFCITHDIITSRKDSRQSLEYFIKNHLNQMKKKVNTIGQCLGIEFIKTMLPSVFQGSERQFIKCVKFCFKILNQQKQKKCVKLFAIKCLMNLLENQEIQLKMEEALANQHQEFCDQLGVCSIDLYYEFAQLVVQNCNSLMDTYLEDVMKSLEKRIEFGCKKINQNMCEYVNHQSIVFHCIKILDILLSQIYTLKYTASLEPNLISITSKLIQPENLQFIDEILDASARFIAYTKGLTEITHIVFDSLPLIIEKHKDLTVESVFRLFLLSTIHANGVLTSNPKWLMTMLDFVFRELQKNNSNEDNIRISILIHHFYQYYEIDQYIQSKYQQLFLEILQVQVNQKEILPKIFISLFMPVIIDFNKVLNPQTQQMIIQTSAYMNITFGKALTLYNYKYYFAICHLLILNSHYLFDEQARIPIIEQLFNNFLNKYAAYVDKITFHQKIGEPNIVQQMEKTVPNFDCEYQENQLELHLKEMSNYKKENQIEKPYLQDFDKTKIMSQQQQTLFVQQILQYLQINCPQIITQLSEADRLLLISISQIKELDINQQQTIRQIMKVDVQKRKQRNLKQYNVM